MAKKIADEAFTKLFKEQTKPVSKADIHMVRLEIAVNKLVKSGLKVPPSGIMITRGGGKISVNKIEMKKRKPAKRKTAAKKKPAKRKAAKKK